MTTNPSTLHKCYACSKAYDPFDLALITTRSRDTFEICSGCTLRCLKTCEGCGEVEYMGALEAFSRRSAGFIYLHHSSACRDACKFQACRICGYYSENPKGHICSNCDNVFVANYCQPLIFRSKRGDSPKPWKETAIGIELEVEGDGSKSNPKIISDIVKGIFGDRAGYKGDGSLNCYGVEIVTHPHTIDTFPFDKLRDLCVALNAVGVTSFKSGRCGLHIHVSRVGLIKNRLVSTVASASKEENLLYHCSEYLTPWLKELSGRASSERQWQYCPFRAHSYWKQCGAGRYALNTGNFNTIEVRFFRGTLHPESAVNSVKFAYYLIKFLANTSPCTLRALIKGRTKPEEYWQQALAFMPIPVRFWAMSRTKTEQVWDIKAKKMISIKEIAPRNDKTPPVTEKLLSQF